MRVQASAQSKMMRAIQEHLTEEEHAVFKREEMPRACRRLRTSPSLITGGLPALRR